MTKYMTIEDFRLLSLDEKARELVREAAEIAALYPEQAKALIADLDNIPPTPRMLLLRENVLACVRGGHVN